MDGTLVVVTGITASAAVVPQVLTWLQNKKRDKWEADREAARIAADLRRSDAETERARVLAAARLKCLQSANKVIAVANSTDDEVRAQMVELAKAQAAALSDLDDLILCEPDSEFATSARLALMGIEAGAFVHPIITSKFFVSIRKDLLKLE